MIWPLPAASCWVAMMDSLQKEKNTGVTPGRQKGPQYKKQRAVQRCPFVASAQVTELQSGANLSARTSELAVGGCYIDTLNPFDQGMQVQVRIQRDDGVFESKAKVVYVHAGFGMGLAFTEVSPEHRTILENWLAETVMQLKPAR